MPTGASIWRRWTTCAKVFTCAATPRRTPSREYKREAFEMFQALVQRIHHEAVGFLARAQFQAEPEPILEPRRPAPAAMRFEHAEASALAAGEAEEDDSGIETAGGNKRTLRAYPVRARGSQKVGATSPVPAVRARSTNTVTVSWIEREVTMEPLTVAGVQLGTARAGIKYPDRRDLVVVELAGETRPPPCLPATPLRRPGHGGADALAAASPRYLVINTGNANAGTGRQGIGRRRGQLPKPGGADRLPFGRGAAVFHRGDRRAAAVVSVGHRPAGGAGDAAARRLGGSRRRHHDHRHPTEAGVAATDAGRAGGDDHRYRQRVPA